MTTTQIILLILGIAILIISFFVVDRNEELENEVSLNFPSKQMTEEEMLSIKHQIRQLAEEEIANGIENTKETLSKLSNETIMAVHDYSEQVLAKIEHNNDEVVFLYSMLTNKEEEYKKICNKMETAQKENAYQGYEQKTRDPMETLNDTKELVLNPNEEKEQSSKELDKVEDEVRGKTEAILKLHNQNYSVLDISKKLGIGQGEVQLVIGIYGKNRKKDVR